MNIIMTKKKQQRLNSREVVATRTLFLVKWSPIEGGEEDYTRRDLSRVMNYNLLRQIWVKLTDDEQETCSTRRQTVISTNNCRIIKYRRRIRREDRVHRVNLSTEDHRKRTSAAVAAAAAIKIQKQVLRDCLPIKREKIHCCPSKEPGALSA